MCQNCHHHFDIRKKNDDSVHCINFAVTSTSVSAEIENYSLIYYNNKVSLSSRSKFVCFFFFWGGALKRPANQPP